MKLLRVMPLAVVASVICVSATLGVTETAPGVDLLELPETDLTGVEERIQSVLKERRDAVATSSSAGASPHDLAGVYGELGRAAMMYELVELTETSLVNATRLDPSDPRWQYLLGVVYQRLQRSSEAAEHFSRMLEIQPEDDTARYRLGEVTLLLGDLETAQTLFDGLPETCQWSAARSYGLGRVHMEKQEPSRAIEHFLISLESQPDVGEIQHQLGMAYRQIGELEAARKYLTSSADAGGRLYYPDPLIEALGEEFPRSSIYLGSKAYEEGRFEEALEYYEAAIASDPDNASYHQAAATALLELGDVEGAIRNNREALRLAPADAMAHSALAGALMQRDGVSPEVLDLYESSVELAGDFKEGLVGLARAYSLSNRFGEALELYGRALEVEPGDPEALYGRSQVLVAIGSTSEAIVDLEAILASDPLNLSAILDLSTLLVRSGIQDEALELLERSLAHEWEPAAEALLAFNAGVIRQQRGEDSQAIKAYRRAVENAPDFDDAHFNLATLLGAAGDLAGAIDHLRRVVDLDPNDRDAHGALATALIQSGRFSEARAALEQSHRDLPQELELTRALVQVLVAAPDAEVRDPAQAIPLALEVQEAEPSLENIGWVIAALAGAERYGEAQEWQIRLINAAEEAGLPDQELQRLRMELEQFRRLEETN